MAGPDTRRVLLVNDDSTQLRLIANILESGGHRVISCDSAEMALEILADQAPPDLIVTDLHMPGIDGWRFCRLLRSPEYPQYNQTPILVVSATLAGDHTRQITRDLGANGFLALPCAPAEFRRCVSLVLDGLSPHAAPKVLIVEDSPTLATILRRAFEKHDYTVLVAETGAQARELFAANRPEVAVLDYHLPDLTGDQLLIEFKQPGSLAAVIMMTSNPSPGLATHFLRLGADGYLRKPFDPAYLFALCEKAQRERALLRVEEILQTRTQELRESFAQLQVSEEKYRSLFENDVIGIFHSTPEGRFLKINKALAQMLGYPNPSEAVRSITDIGSQVYADPQRRSEILKTISRRSRISKFEVEFRRRTGEVFLGNLNLQAVKDRRGAISYLEGFVEDITERKRAEEALKLSEEKMRLVIESSPIGIIITQHGKYLFVNPALVNMFGYDSADEIIGQASGSRFYAEEQELVAQIQVGGAPRQFWPGSLEARGIKKSGEIFEINVWLQEIDYQGEPAILEFIIDVSEAKTLRAQLMQSQKLEAVGTLAGGIAHDFNNILGAIIGYAEMALAQLTQDSPVRYNLMQILNAGQRAADLVNQILTFGRPRKQEMKPLSLAPLIEESFRFMRSSLPATIEINTTLEAKNDYILADMTQIHQILINLCTNAAHAMRHAGGTLEIGLREVKFDHTNASPLQNLKSGVYLELSVRDSGHGMEEHVVERIFDPFFTTKEPGEGTGMGLAVVHGIVQAHGGAILVSSRPRKGTTFNIYLPQLNGASATFVSKKSVQPALTSGHECILLVDDERDLIEIGQKMLTRLGYEVVAQADSQVALDIFKENPQRFDLIITDLTMPALTGVELAREILAVRPDIPIILCTGYSESTTPKEVLNVGVQELIMKPVRMSSLAQTIRKTLDNRAVLPEPQIS